MMVPSYGHNTHLGWPYPFIARNNIVMPPPGKKFDALVNHAVYNRTALRDLMNPDAAYITVLREPTSHLLSAYHYFGIDKKLGREEGPENFERFLNDPKNLDNIPDWLIDLGAHENKTHIKSLTRNLQSADLGLHYNNFNNETAIALFEWNIQKDFHIILILERLSESLVLMKRKLCWKMQDIVRISKNIRKLVWGYPNTKPGTLDKAHEWVNIDKRLYDMGNRKLDSQVQNEERFDDELMIYNSINDQISTFCVPLSKWNTSSTDEPPPLVIGPTPYSEEFSVDRKFCVLLLLEEPQVTLLFKCKQYPNNPQCLTEEKELQRLQLLLTGRPNTSQTRSVNEDNKDVSLIQ